MIRGITTPLKNPIKNSENIAIFDHSSIICWSSITCCCASATSSGKTSTWKHVCQGSKLLILGMVIPPLIGILMYNGYTNLWHLAGILLWTHNTRPLAQNDWPQNLMVAANTSWVSVFIYACLGVWLSQLRSTFERNNTPTGMRETQRKLQGRPVYQV